MSEAPAEYVPDERNDADWWTVRRLFDEPRPTRDQRGAGGYRRLWAVCSNAACGAQLVCDVGGLMPKHANTRLGALPFKCGDCGSPGTAKLTWVNLPRQRHDIAGSPRLGQPRPGSFDFATGKKVGSWD